MPHLFSVFMPVFFLLFGCGAGETKTVSQNMPVRTAQTAPDPADSFGQSPPPLATDTLSCENDQPPFKYECQCACNELGTYRMSNGAFNVYINGTGWNPALKSCWFGWGENVSNMYAGNTGFDTLKVHLLDLEKFTLPKNDTEYGTVQVQQNVIMVYVRPKEGKDTTIVDPFNTGKYHE